MKVRVHGADRLRRLLRLAAVAVIVAATAHASGDAGEATTIPPGLLTGVLGDDGRAIPLDEHGVPARPLSDAELFRVLLRLSSTLDEASLRLARCHADVAPFGDRRWRACVEQR